MGRKIEILIGLIPLLGRKKGPENGHQNGVKFFRGEDGITTGCQIPGTLPHPWGSVFSNVVETHDNISAHLAEQGLLDPKSQHIVLSDPKVVGDNTHFSIQIAPGQRPNNLYSLYIFEKKKPDEPLPEEVFEENSS